MQNTWLKLGNYRGRSQKKPTFTIGSKQETKSSSPWMGPEFWCPVGVIPHVARVIQYVPKI